MRPENLKTRIFLDSGDPEETKEALELLGFLDGQTTNPSLIAKNPQAQERLKAGNKFSKEEVLGFYKNVVVEISELLPNGSVSLEVYADEHTLADTMLDQARELNSWIPNAHIKLPTNHEGLTAAEQATAEGIALNMTLVFTQEQAAAVYSATNGAEKGNVFLSPFIGRLDDKGMRGMDLIKNILRMYAYGDGHVEVLVASVRNLDHFLSAIQEGADIITAPLSVLKEWAHAGMPLPDEQFVYRGEGLAAIDYKELDFSKPHDAFDLSHPLLTAGIERFANDWNVLIRE